MNEGQEDGPTVNGGPPCQSLLPDQTVGQLSYSQEEGNQEVPRLGMDTDG